MQIWVDADACPVIRLVERAAKRRKIPVTLLCDTNHALASDYSQVVVIGAGADAVDFALVNRCRAGEQLNRGRYNSGLKARLIGEIFKLKAEPVSFIFSEADEIIVMLHGVIEPHNIYLLTNKIRARP